MAAYRQLDVAIMCLACALAAASRDKMDGGSRKGGASHAWLYDSCWQVNDK